jgi:hypothetical protein
MAVVWEDFDEAIGPSGLVHIVRKGERVTLCGHPVTDVLVQHQHPCPLCMHHRREAIRLSGGSAGQE